MKWHSHCALKKKSLLLKVIPTFNRASNWVSSWTGNWVGMSHSFCPWTTNVLVPTEGKNHNKLISTLKKFEYKAWNIEILLSWCFSCYYDTISEGLMWVEDSVSEVLMWAVHSTICTPLFIVDVCFKCFLII